MLNTDDLIRFGMRRVARMDIDGDTVRTTFVLPKAERWLCTVYAIVFGGVVVRLGASKDILRRRCRETDRILSEKYRNPQSKKTTVWEAQGYRECFERQ